MSTRFEVPNSSAVTDLLGIIFGEDISVSDSESKELDSKHIATFIDREDNLVAVCACDKPFVGFSGGALSMMPAGAIEDMIAEDDLSGTLLDNFYEVMNISSKLMLSDTSDHLRLDKTMLASEADPSVSELASSSTHVGFELDIPNYGKGSMDFFIA